jgi:hypothetical protein
MTPTMTRHGALGLTLVVAAALGCGGSDSTGPGSNNKITCSITLTGAETGSPVCSNVAAVLTTNDNKTLFGFDGANGLDTVSVAVGFTGAPTVTTYDTDAGASAVLFVENGTTLWTANSSVGSWSLTISSVSTLTSGAGLTGYTVHGTLTATLEPAIVSTSIGPVTLDATF